MSLNVSMQVHLARQRTESRLSSISSKPGNVEGMEYLGEGNNELGRGLR